MKKRKYIKRGTWIPMLLGLLLFAAVAVWMVRGVQEAAAVSQREGLRMAEEAVRRAVVSCYALEGVYPATYEDLKAKSGLAIDEEKYKVFYEIFASNIMPSVNVIDLTEVAS
ncbi:MAG: hypothetical protein K2O45_17660 [Oscillospiraceae bacterium]|nr:hypothetical protein [Oscillospiraceae bacterium]